MGRFVVPLLCEQCRRLRQGRVVHCWVCRCFRIFLNSFIFSSASRKNAPNAGVT